MSAKKTRTRQARDAAAPYVQRLVEDEELRANIKDALEAARKAYGRVANGKRPVQALTEDRKVHRDLRKTAESLCHASDQLRGRRKKRRWGRLLMVALIGAGLAIALNEELRKTVLDLLFGAEEEFEYTSTTTSATETESETAATGVS